MNTMNSEAQLSPPNSECVSKAASSDGNKSKSGGNSSVVKLGQKHLERLVQNNQSYGRAPEGSKTLQRGLKAHNHVMNEIRYLCEVIRDSGIPQQDGTHVITFGKLFQIYTVISDKVVGLLLRARKYGFVDFEGEILYQRRDDFTLITLKNMPPKDFTLTF